MKYMKEMTAKENLKVAMNIAKRDSKLFIVVEIHEPTKVRKLSILHNKDIDTHFEEIDKKYNKNLRLREDYDYMIEGIYLTEDEDYRYMLIGEQPYQQM